MARPRKEKNRVSICVRIDKSFDKMVEIIASVEDKDKSTVIENALKPYLGSKKAVIKNYLKKTQEEIDNVLNMSSLGD